MYCICLDTHVFKSESNESKEADIVLSVFIASHCSTRTIDHLTNTLRRFGKHSTLENLKLKRTKCSSIILNVLEPALLDQLLREVGHHPYSIILDESTDVENAKYMAYCIRYFHSDLGKMVVDFLGLRKVTRGTAVILVDAFIEFLEAMHLSHNKLVGIGTDGANVLCGKNHSFYVLLKKKIPHIQLLKCVCHSLHKCAEYAMTTLPSNIGFLLRESRTWFSRSALRKYMYEDLYQKMNHTTPLKLRQLSKTRWLVVEEAVRTTLNQWECLKKHFNDVTSMVKGTKEMEKCYTARLLAEMYKDDTNFLYLVFLRPILKDVCDLNVQFQASNADISILYSELKVLLMSYANRIFRPSFMVPRHNETSTHTPIYILHEDDIARVQRAIDNKDSEFNCSLLALDTVDLGTEFEAECERRNLSPDTLKLLRTRCLGFLLKLLEELVERLPDNIAVIYKLRHFFPFAGLPKEDEIPWELAEPGCDKEAIRSQWRRLRAMRVEEICNNKEVRDSVEFWAHASRLRNALNQRMFPDLSDFALRALSLPVSNAVVERVFSILSILKSKLRNKMKLNMLTALLRIRTFLSVRSICCENFVVTQEMFSRHNNNMYHRNSDGQDDNNNGTISEESVTMETEVLDELLELLDDIQVDIAE